MQYGQIAGARPSDFADSFAAVSNESLGKSARRTMRPPHCRFLLRSSYNEKKQLTRRAGRQAWTCENDSCMHAPAVGGRLRAVDQNRSRTMATRTSGKKRSTSKKTSSRKTTRRASATRAGAKKTSAKKKAPARKKAAARKPAARQRKGSQKAAKSRDGANPQSRPQFRLESATRLHEDGIASNGGSATPP